ncbi:hypothetical protein M433DRAFT_338629 [Acidomyces richmondensis BFW]|nr:MAG: hypothetical protein FE78DRAFT_507905 [Acidomyces sp. 'richmondensis']KYG49197.1 hypothetical protein M433DRAFT_338629 [Acidomyces richmondensis BFW]
MYSPRPVDEQQFHRPRGVSSPAVSKLASALIERAHIHAAACVAYEVNFNLAHARAHTTQTHTQPPPPPPPHPRPNPHTNTCAYTWPAVGCATPVSHARVVQRCFGASARRRWTSNVPDSIHSTVGAGAFAPASRFISKGVRPGKRKHKIDAPVHQRSASLRIWPGVSRVKMPGNGYWLHGQMRLSAVCVSKDIRVEFRSCELFRAALAIGLPPPSTA